MYEEIEQAAQSDIVRNWLGSLTLSKPIRNLGRDFSDAVLLAEIIAHFLPRYITLSNFAHVNSVALKRYNWETLEKVVLRYLDLKLNGDKIDKLANADPLTVEWILFEVKSRVEQLIREGRFRPSNRRSRSTANSNAGSSLYLNKLDEVTNCCNNGIAASTSSARPSENTHSRSSNRFKQSRNQPPVLDDFTKDQLIEKLYNRIRHLEKSVAEKSDRIAELSARNDRLVEMACGYERKLKEAAVISPPSTPSYSMMSKTDSSFMASGGGRNGGDCCLLDDELCPNNSHHHKHHNHYHRCQNNDGCHHTQHQRQNNHFSYNNHHTNNNNNSGNDKQLCDDSRRKSSTELLIDELSLIDFCRK